MDRLGDFLREQFPMPTSSTVRKTDAAMAATERGECPFCLQSTIDEEGFCQSEECR